jgi:hypothetical protein
MKSTIITIAIFILFAVQTFGNRHEKFDFEKMKAKKVAYLTDAINLTPAEAEKFWPVYNEFDQKRISIMKERRELENKLEDKIEDMSDDKFIELSKKLTSFHKREGDLFVEYNDKFLKILPPRKVVEFHVAEMKFKGYLLREYRKGEPNKENVK